MKTRQLLFVGLFLSVLFPAYAINTNTWPFSVPSQYVVSDSNKIEVADGAAKLKLQAARITHYDIGQYLTNDTALAGVSVGPDASVGLVKYGSQYSASGAFSSRVMDGGIGNTWETIRAKVSNRTTGPSLISVSASASNLVALYHLDNSWKDEITGLSGVTVNSPTFTSDRRIGTHAGYFFPGYYKTVNSTLLHGQQEFCIAFWVKFRGFAQYGGLVAEVSGNLSQIRVTLGGPGLSGAFNQMLILVGTAVNVYGTTPSRVLVTDQWYHVAAVRDSAGMMRLYLNGVLEGQGVSSGALSQQVPFNIGNDAGDAARTVPCTIDEVAIFSRALTAGEINEMYTRAASVGYQVRSGGTPALTGEFVGPDGTSASYYSREIEKLVSGGSFNIYDRYLQYKISFASDMANPPYLESVTLAGNRGWMLDDTYGDLSQGTFVDSTTNVPAQLAAQYITLARKANGGVNANGTFTSRVLDAGASVTWNQIAWTLGNTELASSVPNLEGLWHMNEGWGDASGKGHVGNANGVAYTLNSKLGSASAVFDGLSSYVDIGNIGVTIKTLELWVNPQSPAGGLLELSTNGLWMAISNNSIVVVGAAGAVPIVYVNGRSHPALDAGWNHVAAVFPSAATADSMVVGRARGSYFMGQMDELAIYSRALTSAEVAEHYVTGKRDVAGRVRLQARADNVNPPQTPFVGNIDTAGSYFLDPAGSVLPPSFISKRYLQYRVLMEGDGSAGPAVQGVTVQYGGQVVRDTAPSDIMSGSFDAGSTYWHGNEIVLQDVANAGPSRLDPLASSGVLALWRMDESQWDLGLSTVMDSSGNGRHGVPYGSAAASLGGQVGIGCGYFPSTGYVSAAVGDLSTNDFSVSCWFKTSAGNRSAAISTYSGAGAPYFALEVNGNGVSAASGAVTFVVSDGSVQRQVVAARSGLNDGNWHHLSGLRNGAYAHLYVDGRLAGTESLGGGFGSLGSGQVTMGKHGSQNLYFNGYLDEAVIHGRALTGGEIGELAAAGYNTRGLATFTGPVIDGGQATYWERLYWATDCPYGMPHGVESGTLVGLWHLDALTNGWTPDASGAGNDGQIMGGAVLDSNARFAGACLALNGGGQYVRIPNTASLQSALVSVEGWAYLKDVASRVIFDKLTVGTGYQLGTDTSGRPYFAVNGAAVTDFEVLRANQWNHLAATYDGSTIRLYVNGLLKGRASATGSPVNSVDAIIGRSQSGGGAVMGRLDEVAVYNRVLASGEVSDHYRAGAVTLKFQARAWDSDTPGDFVGPDGTTNTFFMDSFGSSMLGSIGISRYFQYRAYLGTEDARWTPRLQGIRVDASAYPTDNPWVAPADGFGTLFQGNLVSYSHVMQTNADAAVHYQISGNNGTNWYAWVGGLWTDVTGYTNPVSSWQFSNTKDEINANIGTFYDQLYPKVGGVFKFKAFLKSDAIQQTALDSVTLGYSAGRIVVTIPNGLEVGDEAWLIGVQYTLQWLSAGTVSSKLKLEYSLDSGASWVTIATNVPNVAGTNNYSFWRTPGTTSDKCRVRVSDMNDPTIGDVSDSDFSLVERFRLLAPNGGERWYLGRTNIIRWASALNLGLLTLDFAADLTGEVTNYYNIAFGLANQTGSNTNQYPWVTPLGNPALLSEAAKIRIRTLGGQGTDFSDNTFTLAGIEITNPTVGSAVKRNSSFNVRWVSAGAGPVVTMDFSMDGGASWTNVVPSIPNSVGSNTYAWVAAGAPTDLARLRLRSLSDTNVIGVSSTFTLADIDVLQPTAGTNWLMSTTNVVRWAAGGAGNQVNLYYSTNSGASWTPIIQNYTNISGYNTYNWVVPRFPGNQSQVKVESVADPENLWAASPNFNIAGLRVTNPNGGEKWDKDVMATMNWAYQSVGQNGTVQFTYDGGLNYTNIGGPGLGLSDRAYVYTPIKPTVRAKVKIIADDPSPFTNVFDESDAFFTVAGITVTLPTNGLSYTIGTTNPIEWTSAGSEDPLNQAKLYYTTTGTDTNLIATVGNNQSYPGANTFQWNIQPGVIPSATARVIVRSGAYSGRSEAFTLRGIKFTTPAPDAVYDVGGNAPIAWVYAGLDASAVGYLYLSTDGGKTFGATPLNASQVWPVQGGGYPWVVSVDTDPTTNAVLKYVVTSSAKPEDVGFQAYSQPFVIRGMKILQPNAASVWKQGQTNTVVWLAAQAGTYASLYYSADGITYDMARPMAVNQTLVYGSNTFSWIAEYSRMPSTNAHIKIVSSASTAESKAFTLGGIRVTTPASSDVWASGETNRIVWTQVGASGDFTISLLKDGVTLLPIAAGVTDPFYDWVVPTNAVSTNVVIIVRDAVGLTGQSDRFRIVGEPSVSIVAPAQGDFWKVSQSYTIQWSKGGKMANNFRIQYSTEPFVVTNEIYTGIVDFDVTNNIFSIPWTVPDRLGSTIIIIQHNDIPTIRDTSNPFYVVGMFTMVSPNGGETNIYALKPITLTWMTRGSVPAVNLYYSTVPLHGTGTWVRINGAPVVNNGGGLGDQVTSYDWTTADVESDTVRIRVEQADRPGAYDDSDADFAIRYYQIIWNVYDQATTNLLDKLGVTDSSGWSQGDLASPVIHRYPYGVFDTVWSREYFFNNVVFKWSSEPSRVIDVPMKRSDVEPDFSVMANFVYDPTNVRFRVNSWLQQRGKVVTTPSRCVISVYDDAGASVSELVSTTPDANGVFWQLLPTTLERGRVYYAKVEIEYSAVKYSSGVTFNLRVPTDAEQAQQMLNLLTNIQDTVSRVDTNLTDLATAQAIFRQGAMEKLDTLTNAAAVIRAGITNLDVKLDLLATQAIARLDILTNTIGVIGPGESNLVEMVKALTSAGTSREARILTRPTTVKYGAALNILYRSKELLNARCQVRTGAGVAIGSPVVMGGAGGLYDVALTATWGLGDYQIECYDDGGGSDRMIVKVVAMELDDVAGLMGSVSGQLAGVEFALSNVSAQVEGTASNMASVINVVDQLAQLTNMNTQVALLTNAMTQIAGLTNMSAQLNYMTNVIEKMAGVTNVTPQLAYMSNIVSQLTSLTNFGPQLNYMTNIVGQLTGLTNISAQVAQMTNAVAQVAGVTNLIPQMAYLTNAVAPIATLTNQMNGLAGAIGQLSSLTNLGAQVDALGAVIGQVVALTNLAGQVDLIAGAVDRLGGLTNLDAKMDLLAGQVTTLTNLPSQMNGVVTAIGQLGSLTNLGPQVDTLVGAIGQITALTNMASQLDYLKTAMDQMGSLTNLGPQVDTLVGAIGQITALTNMASQLDYLKTAMDQMGSLTNLGPQVDTLVGAIGQITALTNMASQLNYLTNSMGQLSGITNLGTQVDQLTTTVGKIATLTNLTAKVDAISVSIGQLGGLTNLGPQVSQLIGAMDQILALTNMTGQIGALSTSVDQLKSITNLNTSVSQIAASVGQLAGLTNLVGQVDGIAAAIGQMGALTNLGPQVDGLIAGMAQIVGLTNLAGQVNGIVTGIGELNSATLAISNALAELSTSMGAVQTMSNSLASVSTMQASLTDMTAMSSNIYDVLEVKIGEEGDAATEDTVFGRLMALEEGMKAVGGQTASAISKASGARSQASTAAAAAQRVKKEIGAGQFDKVATDVNEIRRSLESVLTQVQEIPGALNTESLVKTVKDAMGKIEAMGKARGITPLGAPTEVEPGALTDPQAVNKLMNSIAETKAMMEAMRLLMDEAVNKPVVVDWLEGSK